MKDGLTPAEIAARLEIELSTVGYYTYAARKERLLPLEKRGGKAKRPGGSRITRRSPFEPPDADPSSGVGSGRPDEEDDPCEVTAELTGDLAEREPRE